MDRDYQLLMDKLNTIERSLNKIDRKLSVLITEKKKTSWVRASVVMEIAGWNKYQMQNRRETLTSNLKNLKRGYGMIPIA